ncbi:hypothetical protein AB0J86_36990 [Micromonospora sp. NPDC049559]|uniref:hypothetical protein n=1 Tax=Micromonospora sp. NPDC049559 TaxID=3155923 RepID=UPI00344956DD
MSSTEIVVSAIIIVVLAAVIVAARVIVQQTRRRALRTRFGPEYDRAVETEQDRTAAERELRARERRHAELTLTPLSEESRRRYAQAWRETQARFVDSPGEAVGAADELVTRLVAERGYPTGDYSDQLSHLSVEHARTLGSYRDAHEIRLRQDRGEASTEELRQAVVHYRALFADLLGEEPVRQQGDPADRRAAPAEGAPQVPQDTPSR